MKCAFLLLPIAKPKKKFKQCNYMQYADNALYNSSICYVINATEI